MVEKIWKESGKRGACLYELYFFGLMFAIVWKELIKTSRCLFGQRFWLILKSV